MTTRTEALANSSSWAPRRQPASPCCPWEWARGGRGSPILCESPQLKPHATELSCPPSPAKFYKKKQVNNCCFRPNQTQEESGVVCVHNGCMMCVLSASLYARLLYIMTPCTPVFHNVGWTNERFSCSTFYWWSHNTIIGLGLIPVHIQILLVLNSCYFLYTAQISLSTTHFLIMY